MRKRAVLARIVSMLTAICFTSCLAPTYSDELSESCDRGSNSASDSLSGEKEPNTSSTEKPEEEAPPKELEMNWEEDGTLKILTIGNSFSDDSMEYVYQIAKSVGVKEVKLGNLYIGGCSLATHAINARSDGEAYEYRTNSDGTWNTRYSYKMSTAIQSEDWDYISLQQASGDSGRPRTYGSSLKYLIDYVKGLMSENTKLVWNMTWAYQKNSTHKDFANYGNDQMKMYESIVNAVKEQVWAQEDIKAVIPTGTAIQNARTSFVGDTLTRDGFHLSLDFGRYIAGMTFVRYLTGLSVDGVDFVPFGVNEAYKRVAIEAANHAVENAYTVTPSAYTTLDK